MIENCELLKNSHLSYPKTSFQMDQDFSQSASKLTPKTINVWLNQLYNIHYTYRKDGNLEKV